MNLLIIGNPIFRRLHPSLFPRFLLMLGSVPNKTLRLGILRELLVVVVDLKVDLKEDLKEDLKGEKVARAKAVVLKLKAKPSGLMFVMLSATSSSCRP